LNTPLATIITSTELALRKERDPEALRDMLGSNLEELYRMAGIVKDMLFLSHAERGVHARRSHVPSLAALAADVADYHEAVMLDAEVEIEIVGDIAGEFDIPLIKRAISNLLGNAIRYAARGSMIRIGIAPYDAGMVRLAVINRGRAIAPEHLPHLFDRFYRADPSRTQSDVNHGLGLSIVAAIAHMHDGRPFVESGEDQTTIGIILPISGDRS
jgi:two-component system, OmpR family, heavy metal sensor histidine kinase CusS